MAKIRFLSLFSGIEAASQAWLPLGFECVAVSEIDPFCCALLAHHYPDVPNLGDVSMISEAQIKALGRIDIVVFGSPCQDLSVAGKRQGLSGSRSCLFYHAMRIINYAKKHNQLRFALWENVKGALSSQQGYDFAAVACALSDLPPPPAEGQKYAWKNAGALLGKHLLEWRTLDAQYFGIAQRRQRVFALADFGAWQNRPPILLESQSLCGATTACQTPWQGATRCSSHNTATTECYSIMADITPKIGNNIAPTLRASTGGGINPPFVAYALDRRISFGSQKELAHTLCASDYKDVQAVYAIAGNTINRSDKHGGNGTGVQQDISYTLTTADLHAVSDLTGAVRRLTEIECERLMGFCDNYTKIPYRNKSADQCPKAPRYKALGNSMAVPVMQWIGERIQIALQE